MRGLVVVEGMDGSGKSTLAAGLAERLCQEGLQASLLRPLEPDREFVHSVRQAYRPLKEAGLAAADEFFAAYFTHVLAGRVAREIQPAIETGIVVADRYLASHRVNQAAFGLDLTRYEPLFLSLPRPQIVLYADVPLELALSRLANREVRGVGDNAPFLTKAQQGFEKMAATEGWARIDTARAPEAAVEEALPLVLAALGELP